MESELGRRSEELRACTAKSEWLTVEGQELRSRLSRSERDVAGLRERLAAADERAREQLHGLAIVGRRLDELLTGARGQATRIRLGALREAAELSARLDDAAGSEPGADRDRLLDALEDAIDRVAGEWDAAAPEPPLARRGVADEAGEGDAGAKAGGSRRRVSVDVGPFEDFSQLVRFEDAANAIGATGDISIKRFSEGRARIDVGLSRPVDLLRELEERCDLEFKVRSAADDEIVLDVDGSLGSSDAP